MSKLNPSSSGCRMVIFMSISVCLGAFAFSYNTVILTQIAELLKAKNNLTQEQLIHQFSISTSAFNFGAFISK